MKADGNFRMLKYYKDLLLSKRELLDLRASISKTISRIHQSQNKAAEVFNDKRLDHNKQVAPTKCILIEKEICCPHCQTKFASWVELEGHVREDHEPC